MRHTTSNCPKSPSQHLACDQTGTKQNAGVRVEKGRKLAAPQSAASSASSVELAWNSEKIERHLVPWWNSACPWGSSNPGTPLGPWQIWDIWLHQPCLCATQKRWMDGLCLHGSHCEAWRRGCDGVGLLCWWHCWAFIQNWRHTAPAWLPPVLGKFTFYMN